MSVGRPLQFDPEQALDQATEAFWQKGYEATSLQELLEATKLSKSSLYQTFGCKHELFDRCVSRYLDTVAAEMLHELKAAKSGRRFIEDMFLDAAKQAGCAEADRGCLFWNTALEFGQREPQVAKLVKKGIERFSRVFTQAVQRAQEDGEIPKDKDAQALGSYLFSSMSGLRAMLKGGVNTASATMIARVILQALG